MKQFAIMIKCVLYGITLGCLSLAHGQQINQTPTVSPIHSQKELPFRIKIELADFTVPGGIHSGVAAIHDGKWLLLAGRTNGMHNFDSEHPELNFPPQRQNTTVFVVNPKTGSVAFRSLTDPGSGLTQLQIDLLSVTSPQFYQHGKTLYVTGGYGIDTATNTFSTKDVLTAIHVPGLINWVENPLSDKTAAQHIRQIFDPVFKITGGFMAKLGKVTLLVFGQEFNGLYFGDFYQVYSKQVRRFLILDDGENLGVKVLASKPSIPDPNYRRRDLNVIPIIQRGSGCRLEPALVALSGVFTDDEGAWTVPVTITSNGKPHMANPNRKRTFKQGMNNYASANIGLYSEEENNMYLVLPGGITYGYFEDGEFQTDIELPFTNQVTTIRIDGQGRFKQYLMDATYPFIPSYFANIGNPLLFGADALFIPDDNLPMYSEESEIAGIFNLDKLRKLSRKNKGKVFLGYIVGGIESSLPNTIKPSLDSAASPFVFKVTLIPKH